jgi:hypothetical protein
MKLEGILIAYPVTLAQGGDMTQRYYDTVTTYLTGRNLL